MEWYKHVKVELIPSEKIREIAVRCGLRDAISLMVNVPGLRLYIPEYDKVKLQHIYIKDNFNGKNLLSIAVHLGLTTGRVKYMLKNNNRYSKELFSNKYMKLVQEKCGEEVAIRLIKYFYGQYVYIPFDGFSDVRRHLILREFDGKNSALLALKYCVTERHINRIIEEYYKSKSNVVQLDLFKNYG